MHELDWAVRKKLTKSPLKVAVIGAGGTGSEVLSGLTHLHLALRALEYQGMHVTAYDPDTISEANLVRQRYFPGDLGHNKADVLIRRINLSCQLGWTARPERLQGKQPFDLVISCVDSRQSRAELHAASQNWTYWLDCGNDVTHGQVILGTPGNAQELPCATTLHPELMDTDLPEDDTPSCSATEALRKQDLYIGRMVSTHALDLLWQLLRDKELNHHARYFDLRQSSLSARLC